MRLGNSIRDFITEPSRVATAQHARWPRRDTLRTGGLSAPAVLGSEVSPYGLQQAFRDIKSIAGRGSGAARERSRRLALDRAQAKDLGNALYDWLD